MLILYKEYKYKLKRAREREKELETCTVLKRQPEVYIKAKASPWGNHQTSTPLDLAQLWHIHPHGWNA